MDHRVVIWQSNGQVRIIHGINPSDYRGRMDCLIDPVIPRGIPPHQWIKHPNGYIVGTNPPAEQTLNLHKYAIGFITGIMISAVFFYIKGHL